MSSTGQIVGGLILPVVAGILNGSWNAAFSPAANLAVGKHHHHSSKDDGGSSSYVFDLCHHHAWVLFQFYAAVANIILCLFWAGGLERVAWIVAAASTSSIVLVSVFGVLMGIGILLFGEACRIAGVGLGTNLTIGLIMILGTILPLALNKQVGTPSGGMILGGLAIASLGLLSSMKSMQIRDKEEQGGDVANNEKTQQSQQQEPKRKKKVVVTTAAVGLFKSMRSFRSQSSSNLDEEESPTVQPEKMETLDEDEELGNEEVTKQEDEEQATQQPVVYSTLTKIIICAVAAVLCSTLQFAFVFGGELIDLAASSAGPGSTPESGSTAIIWLFVIPLSTIPNIIFGLYKAKDTSINHLWRCPPSRHVKIFFCACIPWIGHINLYGLATSFLPSNIAAAVAWPILMMTTVAWGMILSIYLKEWAGASKAVQMKQKIGLGLMVLGVAVVMASVALD